MAHLDVTLSYAVDSTVATMASEERSQSHANGHIRLLEYGHILRIQNIPNASDHVTLLFVDLKHLLGRLGFGVQEHLHLEWDLVSLLEMPLDLFNA